MNHIGNANKKVSDTPRTDQQNDNLLNSDSYTSWLEISGFARQLERELNSANERIKRLEEALEATANVIGPPGKSTWVSDDELNHAWELYLKAKEAKP